MKPKIKIFTKDGGFLPSYESFGAAGADIRTKDDFILYPKTRLLVHTGIYMQLPEDYEAQIRPRSGLALKQGVTVLNSPGTIDSDYRGEVGVILYNSSEQEVKFSKGDRIAQMVISKYERFEFEYTESLDKSERGVGGFGHTGVK